MEQGAEAVTVAPPAASGSSRNWSEPLAFAIMGLALALTIAGAGQFSIDAYLLGRFVK